MKLIKVGSKLLMINGVCKENQGESVKVSQNRAALFDMTLLMLVSMDQSSVFWVLFVFEILVYSPSGREAPLLSQGSREGPVWVGLGEDGCLVDSLAHNQAPTP